MLRKRRLSGKKESERYTQAQLRKMSCNEVQRYFDAVEPIEDDEVNEIIHRIYPRLTDAITSIEKSETACSHAWSTRRIIALAACLILIIPVVAQAIGIPIWQTVVSWTSEHLNIDISQEQSLENRVARKTFSQPERQVWGDDVCDAFENLGTCPALPTWIPDGYTLLTSSSFVEDENDVDAYKVVNALYQNAAEEAVTLTVEILPSGSVAYGISAERDEKESREFDIDGTHYYIVSNLDTNTAVWQYKNIVYAIGGPLSFDTLEKMIRSIQYD